MAKSRTDAQTVFPESPIFAVGSEKPQATPTVPAAP